MPTDGLLRLVQPLLRAHHAAATPPACARMVSAGRPLPGRSTRVIVRRHGLAVRAAAGQLPARGGPGLLHQPDPAAAGGDAASARWKCCQQVEQYYLKQPEVEHVIGVAGFSFFGRGQNAAIAFVRLKDWDERPGRGEQVRSRSVRKANMTFFRIKQAIIFAINPPPIPELAAVGGFDFRLQDRAGQGRDKLLEARNMALGLAAQDPRAGRRASRRAGSRRRSCCSTSTASRPSRWACRSPTSTTRCNRSSAWPTSTTSCARAACCACRCRPSADTRARRRGHPARAGAQRAGRRWCRCPSSPRRAGSSACPSSTATTACRR